MKKQRISLLLLSLFLVNNCFSQDFTITQPKYEFDGRQLLISYDIISKNESDKFYVWLEVERKNGENIPVKALSGDIGDNNPGKNKKIIWIPENDSVLLNEEVLFELKGEKYVKSYNKGSAILMSTLMPGLGQSIIKKGKPYWLTGIATYGALAGGLIFRSNYNKTYESYLVEEDPQKRQDLYDQAYMQINVSYGLIISAAAYWMANIIWVASIPNKYRPLQNVKLSLDNTAGHYNGPALLTLRINF